LTTSKYLVNQKYLVIKKKHVNYKPKNIIIYYSEKDLY